MLASTLLAIPFVPVFYVIMQRVRERITKRTTFEPTEGSLGRSGVETKPLP